jgi:hypothetical protein
MSETARPNLVVLLDGALLPEDEARTLWMAFSAHMDEHRGDMAGFAKAHGYHEVRPEYRKGQAVLLVSTTAEAAAKVAAPPPKPKGPPAKKGGVARKGGPATKKGAGGGKAPQKKR